MISSDKDERFYLLINSPLIVNALDSANASFQIFNHYRNPEGWWNVPVNGLDIVERFRAHRYFRAADFLNFTLSSCQASKSPSEPRPHATMLFKRQLSDVESLTAHILYKTFDFHSLCTQRLNFYRAPSSESDSLVAHCRRIRDLYLTHNSTTTKEFFRKFGVMPIIEAGTANSLRISPARKNDDKLAKGLPKANKKGPEFCT